MPVNNFFTPDEYLIEALAQLNSESSLVERKAVLYAFCSQFDKATSYCNKKTDNEKLLHKIFYFVEENFNADCSLSNLAANTGYDYYYLSRYFKKIVGISFNSYVTHYRLSNACYLMSNTTMPIIQCAFDSGFTSLRSFNRSFKQNFNITPTAYRNTLTISTM